MTDRQVATVEPATFSRKSGGGEPQPVAVSFFNPTSLQYSVTNTLAQQGNGKQQYVSQSTAKLTMDLVFDTTDMGTDVRLHTSKIAGLMEPGGNEGDARRPAPDIVIFEWGAFSFQGMVETYKETLDFFAPEGVPLRATVNLTLSRQDKVFEADPRGGSRTHAQEALSLNLGGQDLTRLASDVRLPAFVASTGSTGQGASPASAVRRIAAANGLESLRHVGESVTIAPTLPALSRVAAAANAAPADGAAAFGVSIRVGGALSAGISASAGAFVGLRIAPPASIAPVRVDLDRLLPRGVVDAIAVGADSQFRLGGQAELQTGAAFSADVGAEVSLSDELRFDE